MKIGLEMDTSALEERVGLSEKNIAYATVKAINNTAKQVQEQARKNVQSRFTLRQSDFILREAAIIKPFASVGQGRPYAEVAVGQKPRLLLADFEAGGDRAPFVGKNVAVPITGSPARPSWAAPVNPALMITALNLQPDLTSDQKAHRRSIKGGTRKETQALRKTYTAAVGGGRVWKGGERTYMIPGIGIFQRTGKGKKDTTLLYKFMPHPQLKPQLGFLAMAQAQGADWLKQNLQRAMTEEALHAHR